MPVYFSRQWIGQQKRSLPRWTGGPESAAVYGLISSHPTDVEKWVWRLRMSLQEWDGLGHFCKDKWNGRWRGWATKVRSLPVPAIQTSSRTFLPLPDCQASLWHFGLLFSNVIAMSFIITSNSFWPEIEVHLHRAWWETKQYPLSATNFQPG